jgi:hypothetical protein
MRSWVGPRSWPSSNRGNEILKPGDASETFGTYRPDGASALAGGAALCPRAPDAWASTTGTFRSSSRRLRWRRTG